MCTDLKNQAGDEKLSLEMNRHLQSGRQAVIGCTTDNCTREVL